MTAAVHSALVVIVEPDIDTRAEYRNALQASGFDTDEAGDGREALAKAFAARPSALVIDTRLRFINGYELCRMLARDVLTAGVPLVVVSHDAHPDQVERAWEAGANAVLTKPCPPETLVAEVRRIVDAPVRAIRPPMAMAKVPVVSRPDGTRVKVRAHRRFDTTQPPLAPPSPYCPSCDRALVYDHSHVGGVSAQNSEQWDYFRCESCGEFEYRHRTRKLRPVVDVAAR